MSTGSTATKTRTAAASARAQHPNQARQRGLVEVIVELDDGTSEVEHVARRSTSLRGGNELDQARNRRRGRSDLARGPASEKQTPHVERASVDVVLTSPIAGGQTSGVGSVETGLGVESVADLARHGEENGRRRARRHPGVVERSVRQVKPARRKE
jgi:hypothetical protein